MTLPDAVELTQPLYGFLWDYGINLTKQISKLEQIDDERRN